jgi:cytochrome P450
MLIGGRQRRTQDPVEAYLSQPSPPLNLQAPSRDADLPPGPPMLGVPSAVYAAIGFWSRRIPFLERCRARYGTPFTLWTRLPPVPLVWFDDPAHAKGIFQAPVDVLHAGNGSFDLEHFFGRTGLAYMEEDEHLARRKVVNRSTHGDELKRINERMREIAAREVASWPHDELFHVWPYANRLVLKAVCQICFGDDRDERIDELYEVVVRMMPFNDNPMVMLSTQEMSPRVVRALAAYPTFRRFLELRARADRLIYALISDRRRSGEAGGMLGILLAASGEDGAPVPAVEIRDEIMTMFLAGSTTTTAGICWAIEHLARYHAVRERIRAEMAAGEDESYLTATVYELLRRKPPLSVSIPRTVMQPFELDGRVYPRGTRLVVTTYLLHHNPAVYPDPYAFRPERFLERPPDLFSWTPFGGGRRKCLGKAIGENEIKYVMREVLARYELHPERAPLATSDSHIAVLKPARNTRLALSPRQRQLAVTAA